MIISDKLQRFLGADNVFCPIVKERRYNGKRRIYYDVDIPLFFGYVFVRSVFNPGLRDEFEDRIAARVDFLKFGDHGNWATVTDEDIDQLKKEHAALINHEVVLDTTLSIGDIVRFKSGSFENFTGKIIMVFPSRCVAKVMTKVFNDEVPVEVPLNALEQV